MRVVELGSREIPKAERTTKNRCLRANCRLEGWKWFSVDQSESDQKRNEAGYLGSGLPVMTRHARQSAHSLFSQAQKYITNMLQ